MMTEAKFGTGSEGDISEGVSLMEDLVIDGGKFNEDVFGDECAEFVEDVYDTLKESDDRCLVRGKVKKLVGCVSSGLRNYEGECEDIKVDTDEGTVDACDWKGSMNRAWDIAKKIRCES